MLDIARLYHCVQGEGGASLPLAPSAVATVNEDWLLKELVSDQAAITSSFERLEIFLAQHDGDVWAK